MSVLEENRKIIHRYFNEAWNLGCLDVLDEVLSLDYVNHNPGLANPKPGPAGLKPIVTAMIEGFPDLHYTVRRMLVSEDQVAIHVDMTGTHTGNFFGIPATGKTVQVSQMQFERIESGLIVEHWRVTDDLEMLKQLGLN